MWSKYEVDADKELVKQLGMASADMRLKTGGAHSLVEPISAPWRSARGVGGGVGLRERVELASSERECPTLAALLATARRTTTPKIV